MPRPDAFILTVLLVLLAASCAGSTPFGGGAATDTGTRVTGDDDPSVTINTDDPSTAGDNRLPSQTSPVMDVGNPEDEKGPIPIDDFQGLRLSYEDEAHGVRIAYPLGWTVAEDTQLGRILFTSRDGTKSVVATFVVSDGSFDDFVAEAKDPTTELESTPARGFAQSLRGTRPEGNLLHFEQYAGKSTDGGTLIVILSGSIKARSAWLLGNTISTITDDAARQAQILFLHREATRAPAASSPVPSPPGPLAPPPVL